MTTSSLTILRRADHREMPWRNGGGSTLEVARHPVGADMADFGWRISIAKVEQDGPFSAFPGIDRVLTLVSGGAMTLRVTAPGAEGTDELVVGEPFAFPGEAEVTCRVTAPTVDLNVMTRRDAWSAEVRAAHLDEETPIRVAPGPAGATVTVLVVLAGQAVLSLGEERHTLRPLDVAVDPGGQAVVRGTGLVQIVHLVPRHRG